MRPAKGQSAHSTPVESRPVTTTPSPAPARRDHGDASPERPRPRRVALEAGALATFATGLAALLYRVWTQPFDEPLRSTGPDATIITSMVRALQDHGWYFHNPSLNAPFGQQFFDFPHAGESLQLAVIRLFALVTPSAGAAVNLYYLVGFGLLVAVTHVVLRHLRLGAWAAAAVALLYTFLPYHFWHTEDHLYRSTYLTAPLAALVILRVLAWRTTFLRKPTEPVGGWRGLRHALCWRTVASTAAMCVAIATFETMLIAFLSASLGLAALIVAVRRRDTGVLVATGGVIAVTALTFALVMAPNLDFWWRNGTNSEVAKRSPVEQETYGLKISQLLLPSPDHRIGAVGAPARRATKGSRLYSEGGQNLGLVGAVGLVVAVFGLITGGLRRRSDEAVSDPSLLQEHAGLLSLVLVLLSTVSGLAMLLSLAGFAQIRVWNRAVVLIAFFALLTVGLAIDRFLARARAPRGWHRRPVALLAVVGLVAFGIWDTANLRSVRYGTPADLGQLRTFTAATEKALPHDAAVFQLPVLDFPEGDPHERMRSLDQILPYLWSDGLRWSAGGINGRPDTDWQRRVDADDPRSDLPALRGLGFDAISVDTYGYADGGTAVTAHLTAMLGTPMATSPDGRWVAWDLRPWATREGLSGAELHAAADSLVGAKLAGTLPASTP